MDNEKISEYQKNLLKAEVQMRRGKNRVTFLFGAIVGLVICISTRSDGLPILTWITIPAGMGIFALIFRSLFKG